VIEGEGALALHDQLDYLMQHARKSQFAETDEFERCRETIAILRKAFLECYLVQLCERWRQVSEK